MKCRLDIPHEQIESTYESASLTLRITEAQSQQTHVIRQTLGG